MYSQFATAQSDIQSKHRGLVLLEGLAAVIIGLLLLFYTGMTVVVLIQILGFYWIISGILSLVSLFMDRTMWGWKLFVGILGVIAGVVVIRHPLWSAILIPTIIILFLAIQGIINGLVKLFYAFKGGGWGIAILGILNIIFGIILLCAPLLAASILPIFLGVFAIIGGIIAIINAFRLRSSYPTQTQPPATPAPGV
jgi:uncharacterized membrane protein HdeD (DUF308 family)